MLLPIIAAALAVSSAALALIYVSRRANAAKPQGAADEPVAAPVAKAIGTDPDAVERSKQAIHEILRDISAHIRSLAGENVMYGVSLDKHRASDFLARYGGEEFVMILPQTSGVQAFAVADRLREKVAGTRLRLEDVGLNVTVSMGAGEVFPESDTKETLFTRVDAALYRAKHEGRNCVRLAEVSTGQ